MKKIIWIGILLAWWYSLITVLKKENKAKKIKKISIELKDEIINEFNNFKQKLVYIKDDYKEKISKIKK